MVKVDYAFRTGQDRTGQDRTGQDSGLTAPFWRLVAARRLKLNTTFVMDNRRT